MSETGTTTMRMAITVEGAPFLERPWFLGPVVYGRIGDLSPHRILHIGTLPAMAREMAGGHPEAEVWSTARSGGDEGTRPVRWIALEAAAIESAGAFDLVTYDDRATRRGEAGDAVLRAAVGALAPGGALVASFPARLARMGQLAVAELLRLFLAHADGRDPVELSQRVVSSLPSGHHYALRKEFRMELAVGGREALRRLQELEARDLSSLPEVLDRIEAAGGVLQDWLFPSAYDPAQSVGDPAMAAQLGALPEPTRSIVCETITAHPTIHHTIVRREVAAETAPPWGKPELLDWLPVRLPIYDWQALRVGRSPSLALEPSPRTEYTGRIQLAPWHARLVREADGLWPARALLEAPEVRRAFDLPPERWEDETARFLEQACRLRALALLPPATASKESSKEP
jgi:hypothetical protein